MRKTTVFLFLIALLLMQCVKAEISFSLSEKEVSLLTGESKRVYITIENKGVRDDVYIISIWPNKFDDVTLMQKDYRVDVKARESETTYFTITAPETARVMHSVIKVFVQSLNTGEISSDVLIISVKRKFALNIENITLNKESYKPNETLEAIVKIENKGGYSEEGYLKFSIWKNNEKQFEDEKEVRLGAWEVKNLNFSFDILTTHEPGEYEVKVTLLTKDGKEMGTISKPFYIEKVETYVIQKVETPFFLGKTVEFHIKNTGNSPITVDVKEEIQRYLQPFLRYEVQPNSSLVEKEKAVLIWKVSLEPQEEKSISYSLHFYPIVLLTIVVVILGYIGYILTFTVSIRKISTYRGTLTPKKEITVSIEVKNRKRYEINNLVIEDFVPGIVKVVPEFATLKPSIKRTSEGTILTWKIPVLHPYEERILTYKIKPVVKIIGSIRLPRVKLRYKEKRIKKTIMSKSVVIGR